MKKVIQFLSVVMLMLLTAVVTFCVTYQELGGQRQLEIPIGPQSPASQKVGEIEQYLSRYFIDEYDEAALADAAAAAVIAATGDRWSYYISAEEYASHVEQMNNAYVGIGITIEQKENVPGLIVSDVTTGGPADAAGILPGDILIAVEGASIDQMEIDEVKSMVRGESGTSVELTFMRDEEEFSCTLVRQAIQEVVTTLEMLEGDIALVRIKNFEGDSAKQTLACIDDAISAGAKALIFDVRFNPGGFKTELVTILDYLLPEGVLFRSLDYAGNEEEDSSDEACIDLPMAVLINEDTYSAAEFFAAAMQEYEAAVIVGTKTTGKGNFQTTLDLSDGSAVNISIGKYFTPGGKSLTDVGVTPDIEADLTDEDYAKLYYKQLKREEDGQLKAAIEQLQPN